MKAILINKFVKSYDELRVSDVEMPDVPWGYGLVQVKAAGLNFVDLLYSRGLHQNNTSLHRPPFTLGLEFSGLLLLTNPPSLPHSTLRGGVSVYGSALGSFAQYIAVPLSSLRPIPPTWTFRDAAGISATLPVSYGALMRARLKEGETVLIHAAAGGLGLMAVQVAKALGCTVIGTARSESKREVARGFGCDSVVDYTQPGWAKEVLGLTGGRGVDVVFDPVGLVGGSLSCTAHFGRIVVVGFAGREGDMEGVKMNRVLLKQVEVLGYRFGETDRRRPEETRGIWEVVERLVGEGKVRPTVFGEEYRGLESVPRAMDDMAQRKVWGKAVIMVDGEVEEMGKGTAVRAKI